MEGITNAEKQYFLELVKDIDEKTLMEVLGVEEKCFPESMQSDEEDLKETLDNKKGIQIIVKDENGSVVSYLSSLPLEDTFEDLEDYDNELKLEKGILYIESIAIIPESRNVHIFSKILNLVKQEATKRGFKKVSAHVRVSNGLSNILQKMGAQKMRTIEDWHNFNEPFDYLEIEINKSRN